MPALKPAVPTVHLLRIIDMDGIRLVPANGLAAANQRVNTAASDIELFTNKADAWPTFED
jgi:hypothetical protein